MLAFTVPHPLQATNNSTPPCGWPLSTTQIPEIGRRGSRAFEIKANQDGTESARRKPHICGVYLRQELSDWKGVASEYLRPESFALADRSEPHARAALRACGDRQVLPPAGWKRAAPSRLSRLLHVCGKPSSARGMS